ncbi:MAG: CYTH domain-containing protein [Candidatus Vogelbacteria bacterium]
MKIEYEATFVKINKDEIRKRLVTAGAKLLKPEFLQKRATFHFPNGHEVNQGWVRVRDESDKITLSIKVIDGDKIENQKEICLKVDSFTEAISLLTTLGCVQKSYQESKRELWLLDGVEVMIDEWPFLEPFVEIEGPSEQAVKEVAEKIGFEWSDAKFCAVGTLYAEKYGITEDKINNQTPKIVFEMENPFVS